MRFDAREIENAFTYHEPKDGAVLTKYAVIRETGRELAEVIALGCPDSPERTMAINKVREAVMWANAAIACSGG